MLIWTLFLMFIGGMHYIFTSDLMIDPFGCLDDSHVHFIKLFMLHMMLVKTFVHYVEFFMLLFSLFPTSKYNMLDL